MWSQTVKVCTAAGVLPTVGFMSINGDRNLGDVPDDVTAENEALEENADLVSPGSTADGAGSSLGAVPAEAVTDARPLGSGDGTAASGQLADEGFRSEREFREDEPTP